MATHIVLSSIQLLSITKLLIFFPYHWLLYWFLIWFQTWVGKGYTINGFPWNSNILYKHKLMQLLCIIFEPYLQMTIVHVYFCLLSLPGTQKYLLIDQIFYTNSKSEKVRKEINEIKYSANDINLLCFIIMQPFIAHFLKNRRLPSQPFKWLS